MKIKITNKAKAINSIKREIIEYINANMDSLEPRLGRYWIKEGAYIHNSKEEKRAILELNSIIKKGEVLKQLVETRELQSDKTLGYFLFVNPILGYVVSVNPQ